MAYYQDLSEEEQAARAREERLQIVARYDQGREDGAVIDDWEDPKLEIYHTQDRFGFIHDQRQPSDVRRSDEERKSLEKEMNRVDKWLKMLKEQHKWFPRGSKYHEKMNERTWKGVPERMRGSFWRIMLDLDQIKAEQEGKYQEMKELARRHSPDIRQIDLDVNRTYRNHIMFRERYNSRQQDLFHVLAAYSIYNSEVGYCQGMSQIAALLLMYLTDDEDAFWALSQLMVGRKWNMHGFFIPQFPKLMRFQEHHDKILVKKLRRLQKHLTANGVDTGIYTLKWFFQCFLDRLPFSVTIRVWDLYLLEGETIMFAMAFTILKLHRKALLRMGMDELLEFMQKTLETDFGYDDDYAIETALKECLAELRSSRLHTAGPPPENEKPQKPFGLHSFPTVEEEAQLALRRPASEKERLFSEETQRRKEEQRGRLAALNSQNSVEDGSRSSDEADESVITPPPKPWRGATPSNSIPPSPTPPSREQDELDDSLQFMMRQARLQEEGRRGSQGRREEGEREQRRAAEGVRRPASAEPGRSVSKERRRGEQGGKRLSHHGHLGEGRVYEGSRSQSHSKSSFSASRSSVTQGLDMSRTSRTSSELTTTSSRALNTSHDSQSSRASPRSRHSHRTSSKETTPARSQEENSHRREQEQRRLQEAQESVSKKSSYYFGEEPELTNGAGEEVTPTEERGGVRGGEDRVALPSNGEGHREHEGEVVRIRVPYTEPDLTTSYNIQRLAAQRISPRFNGHKVTIQVNHGEGGGGGRLDESFSSEPPLSPASRQWNSSRVSESSVTRRHVSTSEKLVGSSGELHTSTHAMFVSEHRQRMAPLAQQDHDLEDPAPRPPGTNGTSRPPPHRHSLNESYSSSSEGEPKGARTQRHSSIDFPEGGQVTSDNQHLADFRKETFF